MEWGSDEGAEAEAAGEWASQGGHARGPIRASLSADDDDDPHANCNKKIAVTRIPPSRGESTELLGDAQPPARVLG